MWIVFWRTTPIVSRFAFELAKMSSKERGYPKFDLSGALPRPWTLSLRTVCHYACRAGKSYFILLVGPASEYYPNKSRPSVTRWLAFPSTRPTSGDWLRGSGTLLWCAGVSWGISSFLLLIRQRDRRLSRVPSIAATLLGRTASQTPITLTLTFRRTDINIKKRPAEIIAEMRKRRNQCN